MIFYVALGKLDQIVFFKAMEKVFSEKIKMRLQILVETITGLPAWSEKSHLCKLAQQTVLTSLGDSQVFRHYKALHVFQNLIFPGLKGKSLSSVNSQKATTLLWAVREM